MNSFPTLLVAIVASVLIVQNVSAQKYSLDYIYTQSNKDVGLDYIYTQSKEDAGLDYIYTQSKEDSVTENVTDGEVEQGSSEASSVEVDNSSAEGEKAPPSANSDCGKVSVAKKPQRKPLSPNRRPGARQQRRRQPFGGRQQRNSRRNNRF